MILVLIIRELFIGRARLHRIEPQLALSYCNVLEQEDDGLEATDHIPEISMDGTRLAVHPTGMIYTSGGDSGFLRTHHFEELNFTTYEAIPES